MKCSARRLRWIVGLLTLAVWPTAVWTWCVSEQQVPQATLSRCSKLDIRGNADLLSSGRGLLIRCAGKTDYRPDLELHDTVTGTKVSFASGILLQKDSTGQPPSPKSLESQPKIVNATINGNGTRIAVASDDGMVRLWDVEAAKLVAFWTADKAAPDFLQLSPDGKRILAITWRNFVSEKEFFQGGSARGSQGIVGEGSNDEYVRIENGVGEGLTRYWRKVYRARLWDAETGIEQAILPNENLIGEVAFSPDGLKLAICCDTSVKLLEVKTGQVQVLPVQPIPYGNHVHGYVGRLSATRMWLSFSTDGKLLAATDCTGTATMWETDSGREIACYLVDPIIPQPDNHMRNAQLALGNGLAAVSYMYLQRPDFPGQIWRRFSQLISSPENGICRAVELIDPVSGASRVKIQLPLGSEPFAGYEPCQIAFLPDGNTLVVYDPDQHRVMHWDVRFGDRLPASAKWLATFAGLLLLISWRFLVSQDRRGAAM